MCMLEVKQVTSLGCNWFEDFAKHICKPGLKDLNFKKPSDFFSTSTSFIKGKKKSSEVIARQDLDCRGNIGFSPFFLMP